MKKLLSIALSLLMVFSIIPMGISAFAYEESTVCVIGGNEYSSLFGEGGAFADAAEGDTIILVKDIKETGGVTLDKAVTLDLAGHNVINYSTAKVITTTKDITVRSTVDGKGATDTESMAKFGYSGVLFNTSANVIADNVYFYESNNFPEYNTDTNLLDGVEWVFARYRTNKKDAGVNYSTYDNYTQICTKTLIPVEAGKSYYFTYETTKSDSFKMTILPYKRTDNGDGTYTDTCLGSWGSFGNSMYAVGETSAATHIGINLYCSNNEWSYNSAKTKMLPLINSQITPIIYQVIDSCSSVASANDFVAFSADNTELKLDNCVIDKTVGTTTKMNFTKVVKFDVKDSKFLFPNLNGSTALTFNNASISGTFKNVSFSASNANAVVVTKASTTDGITLDNCTITTSGDSGKTALTVSAGLVKLIGGTIGNTYATSNTYISGGTVTVDGTTFNGSKGNYVLNIGSSADVTINSATIVKSSGTINSVANFWKSLAAGKAVYTSTTKSADTIVVNENDVGALDVTKFYVADCNHYCATTQDGSTTCAYCKTDNAPIAHDYSSSYLYDETGHWHECQRCYGYSETVPHSGGTATCTTKAVCSSCKQSYGDPIPHAYTNYVKDETHSCGHIEVKTATCDYNCGATETLYNGIHFDELDESLLNITKELIPATCTQDGSSAEVSCATCSKVIIESEPILALNHDLGEVKFDNADGGNKFYDSNYLNEGWGYQECQRDGCGYIEEGVIPVKEFDKRTVAITGGYDNPTEYKTLLDAEGAIANANEGDTIILIKDVAESATATIDKNITIDLAGHTLTSQASAGAVVSTANLTIRSTVDGLGETNTDEKAKISYAKVLVKGDKTYSFSNVALTATAEGAFFTATADGAELVVKDSSVGVASASIKTPLVFTSYATKVDFENVPITLGNANNAVGLSITKAVTGTFKNCKIRMDKGLTIQVSNANADITFDGCTISSGGNDQWYVFSHTSGKITLCGGTVVNGAGQNAAYSMSGGTLITDDATIRESKGDSAAKVTFSYTGGTVELGKTTFVKSGSGSLTNVDDETFLSFINEDYAFFKSSDTGSGEFAYDYGRVSGFSTQVAIYIDKCAHWETTAGCGEAGNCKFCNKALDALGHDYSVLKTDEESGTHYKVCSRCGDIDETSAEVHDFSTYKRDFVKGTHYKVCSVCGLTDSSYTPEAHYGGTATCTELAKCDLCGYEYGEYAHVYTKNTLKYDADSHWVVCDLCGGGEKEAEEHHSDTIVCQHKQVCDTCDQEFGEVIQHNFNHYVSNNDATCLANGTETSKCAYGCKDADGNYITDTRTVLNSALGHNLVKDSGTAATCSKTGLTERVYCDRDGCTYVKVEETIIPIAKDAHLWDDGKFTSTGDCAHDCIYTYTCKHCGITKSYNYGKVPGKHVYSSTYTIDVKPTYFKTGVKSRHCKYCSAKTSVKKIAKLSPKVKITTSKGKIKVKYTKATGANYFQVRYKIGTKTVTKTYKSSKTVTKTIKNLKKGKYKVWVRAMYKKGSTKKYSSWTKAKAVKVK